MTSPAVALSDVEASAATAGSRPLSSRPRLTYVALLVGAVISMADATLVAVALNPLSRDLGETLAAAQATITVYLVTLTATLPLTSRLADRVGRREAYCAGFVVFGIGSVVAGLAWSMPMLLGARAVQAVGGGMLTAGSLTLMAQHVGRGRTGRGVAHVVVAQATAGLLAPIVGGILVVAAGWHAVFWGPIPIAIAGLALTLALVPRTAPRDAPELDLVGALGLGGLLLGTGAAIASIGAPGLLGLDTRGWLVVAVASVVVLVAAETRARHPVVDLGLLRGAFGRAALASFLSTGSLMSCFALVPYWLEHGHGASPALAGVALLPPGIGIGMLSSRGGRMADQGRTRAAVIAGMTVAATGFALAAVAAVTNVWPLLAVGLLVLGCGNGLFSSPNTAAALRLAPRHLLASAVGLLSTARNAGVIVGLGAAGGAYAASSAEGAGDGVVAVLFGVAAINCLIAGAVAAWTYGAVQPGNPRGTLGAALTPHPRD